MDKSLIEKLEQTMQRIAMLKLSSPLRPAIAEMKDLDRHSILLGPRGTGKTTFMLKSAANRRILYFSADDFDVPANSIHDIASDAFLLGYEGVFIDEIHFDSNWDRVLKSLYDKYEDKIIWASDSSSLRLRSAIGATARRYIHTSLPLMSFREYLFMKTGKNYPKIDDPFNAKISFPIDSDYLYNFENYKKEGFLPIFLTGNYEQKLKDIIAKIITSDIPFFIPEIRSAHIQLMREITTFLAKSSVPRIVTENMTREWNISYEKLIQLLHVMEETSLISIIPEYNDNKEKFSRSKVFLTNPSAYMVLSGREGNLREALVSLAFKTRGMKIFSSPKEESGDFIIIREDGKPITIEVGGKKKKFKESDYVIRDNIEYPASNVIPLYLIAMMW